MPRLNSEKQKLAEPKRIDFAKQEIQKLGYEITHRDETTIVFQFEGSQVKFFPYSGWATGKTIKDGRGLSKLLRQIKK